MDPYAKARERKVGAQRPKIKHLPHATEPRTRRERQAQKEAVAAQRRAIKKAARRHLKEQLLKELEEDDKGHDHRLRAAASQCKARRP
ncbi:MAG: hypothetical protein DME98_11350 [Verrucomicrobia bacterium]|nr:MAG: hypothetical protein DME98_11350 [Verrucomicrobiota bacterium]PYJ32026.1 MAG: hypothetical protein DME88_12430 [Verrucomicrobiota bacterium]